MNPSNQAEHTEYGSAEEYFSIIRRIVFKRWWLIGLLAVAAGVAGLGGSMLVEPVYRAGTTIRIQQNLLGQMSRRSNGYGGVGALDTEAAWIKNRSLLEEVMDKTGAGATAKSPKERVAVMEKLRDSINVTTFSDSLHVSVDWNDAELAAKIANTLADSFIERYGALNRDEARERRALVEQQASLVRLRWDDAQQKFLEFVKQHGDIAVSERGSASSERLMEAQANLARNNIALADASRRLDFIEKELGEDGQTLSTLELGPAAEQLVINSSVQMLKEQVLQLQQQVTALSRDYKDEFPDLKKAKVQLSNAQQALAAEIAKLVPDAPISLDDPGKAELVTEYIKVNSEVERLERRQSELTTVASKLEQGAKGLPDKEAQYFTLLRNKTINEDLYNTLLTRLTEARLAEQTDNWDVRVIERAYVPYTRLKPKPVKNAVFGTIIGVLLSVGLCMLLEYLDDSFKTAAEVEGYLQLPVLAVLPSFDRLPQVQYGSEKHR
jgi:uncharacterized protein involved in exopolysaccharide biosynthesis